jgi:hypothetical protein
MRRLPALLLACAVLLVVCVPTTHAMKNSPDTPTADKVFRPEKPNTYDDIGWVDLKSNDDQTAGPLSFWALLQAVVESYYNLYFSCSPLTNTELEAWQDYDTTNTADLAPSGITHSR